MWDKVEMVVVNMQQYLPSEVLTTHEQFHLKATYGQAQF